MTDQFEYKIVEINYYSHPFAHDLTVKDFNELGKEGWILSQFRQQQDRYNMYIFYRKLNNKGE